MVRRKTLALGAIVPILCLTGLVSAYAQGQGQRGQGQFGGGRMGQGQAGRGIMGQLQLTERQQTKANTITTSELAQIKAVLTPEQVKLWDAAMSGPRGMGGPGRQGGPGMMPEGINLTEEQQSKVQGIYSDSMSKMQALRGDESLSDSDRRTQMQSIMQSTQSQVRAVLTPEQAKIWDASVAGMGRQGMSANPLNLTADQQSKIQAIMADQNRQMQALGNDKSLSDSDRMAKMQAIGAATTAKFKEILTAEQFAQWQRQMSAGRPSGRLNAILGTLKLTEEQQTKITAIQKNSATAFGKILTPEQISTLDKIPGWEDRFPF